MTSKERNNFIQVGNYIIRVSEISFIKKGFNQGNYYLYIYTEKSNIDILCIDYDEREKYFKHVLKELNGE